MHVLGDFLKCRIAPLQQRSRLSYWLTIPNDHCRVQRGLDADLSRRNWNFWYGALLGRSLSLST
jgi:hypothetical protein